MSEAEDVALGRSVNYANALELIRRIAFLHYIGGAFEPEHMRALGNIAADALSDVVVPEPPDQVAIAERAHAEAEKYTAWLED